MNSITIKSDPTPEPVAPSVDVVETANGGVQVVPKDEGGETERPGWLPEKFKTPEDLAKAYGALEAKLGAPVQDPPAPEGEETESVEEVVEAKGLDFDALTTEFTEKGELSAETYAALEKSGISRTVADSYIAGQQALAERQVQTLAADVGGTDALTAVLEWAGTNLSDREKAAYNGAVDSGNIDAARLALRGINARFVSEQGRSPNLVSGEAAKGGIKPFESQAQIVKAMSSQEYKTDPAYRRTVEQRMAVSTI